MLVRLFADQLAGRNVVDQLAAGALLLDLDLDDQSLAVHLELHLAELGVGVVTLRHREPWMGEQDHRLELMARTRLWRYLTGDDAFDLDWYHTRLDGRASLETR